MTAATRLGTARSAGRERPDMGLLVNDGQPVNRQGRVPLPYAEPGFLTFDRPARRVPPGPKATTGMPPALWNDFSAMNPESAPALVAALRRHL